MAKKIFGLLLVLFALASCSDEPDGPATFVNETDRAVIAEFYKCARLDPEVYPWNLEDSKTWNGVTLEEIGGELRVTRIDVLVQSGVASTLTPEIGKLGYLRTLKFDGNRFCEGQIPREIYNCPLDTLMLYFHTDSYVTGGVYREIEKVSPTLSYMVLRCVYAEFEEGAAEALASCKNVRELRLADCHMEGTVPAELGRMYNCYIDLCGNNFTSIDWDIFNYWTIPLLYLNRLEGEIPEWVLYTRLWQKYGTYLGGQYGPGLTKPLF